MDHVLNHLELHLDEQPDDWDCRLALADRHEELGQDDWARYYRWTVRHRKRPNHASEPGIKGWVPGWYWWYAWQSSYCKDKPNLQEAILPDSLTEAATWTQVINPPSRQMAEARLKRELEQSDWPEGDHVRIEVQDHRP